MIQKFSAVGALLPPTLKNAVISAHNIANGRHYEKHLGELSAVFYCPSVESWKAVNTRLASEKPVIEEIIGELEEFDTPIFYDIGANVGNFSCFCGQIARKTVAFEPYPPNLDLLNHNLSLNEIPGVVEGVALGASDSKATFKVPKSTSAGVEEATIMEEHWLSHEFVEEIEVNVRRLDTHLEKRELEAPDVMKIDVEGASPDVLDGSQRVLEESHPTLFVEPHGNSKAVKTILKGLGYKVNCVRPDRAADEPTIVAR